MTMTADEREADILLARRLMQENRELIERINEQHRQEQLSTQAQRAALAAREMARCIRVFDREMYRMRDALVPDKTRPTTIHELMLIGVLSHPAFTALYHSALEYERAIGVVRD